ncbi:unnamed protein product, partial [marine sediment metagenome]
STLSKGELYQIHNDLFNSPPTNFELIESITSFKLFNSLEEKGLIDIN